MSLSGDALKIVEFGQRLKAPPAPPIPQSAWELQKDFIYLHYIEQNEPMWQVLQRLQRQSFPASIAQFRQAIARWGFRKNQSRTHHDASSPVDSTIATWSSRYEKTFNEVSVARGFESTKLQTHKRTITAAEFEADNTDDVLQPTPKRARFDSVTDHRGLIDSPPNGLSPSPRIINATSNTEDIQDRENNFLHIVENLSLTDSNTHNQYRTEENSEILRIEDYQNISEPEENGNSTDRSQLTLSSVTGSEHTTPPSSVFDLSPKAEFERFDEHPPLPTDDASFSRNAIDVLGISSKVGKLNFETVDTVTKQDQTEIGTIESSRHSSLMSARTELLNRISNIPGDESVEILKERADLFFCAEMYSDAFDLYYHCYSAEFAKLFRYTGELPRILQRNNTSHTLILSLTDMARSALVPYTISTVSEECLQEPWASALTQPPWNRDSTALFLLLNVRGFVSLPEITMASVQTIASSHERDFRYDDRLGGSSAIRPGARRFSLALVSLLKHDPESCLTGMHSKTSPDSVKSWPLFQHCLDLQVAVMQRISNILGYFIQLLRSSADFYSHLISEMSQHLWPPKDGGELEVLEHYLFYGLLSRIYELLIYMKTNHFLEAEWAPRAKAAFVGLKHLHDIGPYYVMKEIAAACFRVERQHDQRHHLRLLWDYNEWRAAFLRRMDNMMSEVKRLCDISCQERELDGRWDTRQYRIVVRPMLFALLTLRLVSLKDVPQPGPKSAAMLRLHVAYSVTGTQSEAQSIRSRSGPDSADILSLSDKSSRMSEFFDFTAAGRSSSLKSSIMSDIAGYRSANSSRSSIGKKSFKSFLRAPGLLGGMSESSSITHGKSASLMEMETVNEDTTNTSQS